ncbi:MAG: hypothetical protein ACK5BJ_07740 [Bacteroidota bacterium]
MLRRVNLLSFVTIVALLSCSSSKTALRQQDYYSASLRAIERLHTRPGNKASIALLIKSYPIAVELIENSIKRDVESDNPNKWRNSIEGYSKINKLAEKITSSIGAREVIKDPVVRYKELASTRDKAAEEVYQKGIEKLMANNRQDAKSALAYFKEAHAYRPEYREVVEMTHKAEYVATIHVGFEEINKVKEFNISFEPQINSQIKPFLSFAPFSPSDSIKPQQKLTIIFNAYRIDSKPTITKEMGEKETRTSVQLSAQSEAIVRITDLTTGADMINNTVLGNALYTNSFTNQLNTESGNAKPLSRPSAYYGGTIENRTIDDELLERSIDNLRKNIVRLLSEFYKRY